MEGLALDEDTIDDLLYFARMADAAELRTTLEQVSQASGATPCDILTTAKDVESGNTVLHMAAANGHVEIVRFILSFWQTAEPVPVLSWFLNARNNSGNTPLHWAALNGHLSTVQVLADAGSDLQAKNDAGHDAAYEAELAEKEDVVTWLLKANVDGIPETEQEADVAEGLENGMTEDAQPAE